MNVLVFITHTTLTKEHADCSIESLKNQTDKFIWDQIYIYNTHENELSNEYILNKFKELYLTNIDIIPYNLNDKKTLCQDIFNIQEFLRDKKIDNLLLLKSDYALSTNFYHTINNLNDDNFIYTLPVLNAKEFISNDEILKYCEKDQFIKYNNEIYYRGSDNDSEKGVYNDSLKELNENIKYISSHYKYDFNVHYLKHKIFNMLKIDDQQKDITWGGILKSFLNLKNSVNFLDINNSFCIHIYHGIKSINRTEDRTDGRKTIYGHRY